MTQYICPICHRLSYTAADPKYANSDKCPYEGCDGHVVPVVQDEPKRTVIIKMVRKGGTK